MSEPETPLEAASKDVKNSQGISPTERRAIKEHPRLRAAIIYEIIRGEGEAELTRSFHALFWSGIAAGLSIGFSFLTEAWIASKLPEASWTPLIDNLGYSVGFLIVILGHQQLFTENTLTAVLPVIARRKLHWLFVMLRLWLIVLIANVIGCLLFALFLSKSGAFSAEVHTALTHVAEHLMANTTTEMFVKGIVAGWLIAALVWILPSVEGAEFSIILLITYLIALGDLTHVVAGSAEALFLVIEGKISLEAASLDFFLPTLAGNIVGGTVLFSVLSYVQVREEIDDSH